MGIASETSATDRGSSMTRELCGQQPPEEQSRFCRGCGYKLPVDFRRLYHKECLRADKRRRICEQRRREQERFKRWLEKQHCLNCGAKYRDRRSGVVTEASCEASQRTQEF